MPAGEEDEPLPGRRVVAAVVALDPGEARRGEPADGLVERSGVEAEGERVGEDGEASRGARASRATSAASSWRFGR